MRCGYVGSNLGESLRGLAKPQQLEEGFRMKHVLNLLWLIFGGLHVAINWFLASLILAVTIVGLPWARAAFNICVLSFLPFGSFVVSREDVTGKSDIGTGSLGLVGNILWAVLAGWWLFLFHLFYVIFFGVTIIGIPFALQHWKLAKLSFLPVGKKIISVEGRH